MDESRINKVIEIISKSHQSLVWLDAISTPVRKFMGESYRDLEMYKLMEILKERNIIDDAAGFASLMETPWYVYITSFTLTKEFFKKTRKKEYKQLKLFKE